MTKTKWALVLLVTMDILLVIMHATDYFFLFFKPTGYVIPFAINIIVLAVIGFRAPKIYIFWPISFLCLTIPILLIYSFMIWFMDYNYTIIDSPHDQQSLFIEYRDFTLGETTYFYNFYKTKDGIVGKKLEDEAIELVIQGTDRPSGELDAKGALGVGEEQWITEDIVRFSTWKGLKEVQLNSTQASVNQEDIEIFIARSEDKENGYSITINGNHLETRFDESSGDHWIDVSSDYEEGAIPTQQCSRIIRNEERGYFILEECTHQWEYLLYPMERK